ncbi:hypothetical protein H8356DRAFT_1330423 [Neocallimastix lanati (nom. inval.)]|nr:hypothetical protein H8356DRAFT_1330423 [Neocallimastix sp. JGI-2020a]
MNNKLMINDSQALADIHWCSVMYIIAEIFLVSVFSVCLSKHTKPRSEMQHPHWGAISYKNSIQAILYDSTCATFSDPVETVSCLYYLGVMYGIKEHAAKVKSDLPHLEDYKKNVLEWIEDLKEYLILYDITKPRKVFTWVLAAVEVNVKIRNGEERYPKFSEIRKAVERYLEITEGDKWTVLRNLTIVEGETILLVLGSFHVLRYLAKVDTLQEVYEIAEDAETTEQEIQERNDRFQPKRRRNFKNVTMVTQARNFLTTYPIYWSFRNENEGNSIKTISSVKVLFLGNESVFAKTLKNKIFHKLHNIQDRVVHLNVSVPHYRIIKSKDLHRHREKEEYSNIQLKKDLSPFPQQGQNLGQSSETLPLVIELYWSYCNHIFEFSDILFLNFLVEHQNINYEIFGS